MNRRVIDTDGFGVENVHYFDNETGLSTIRSEVDAQWLLDFNRKQFNDANRRFGDLCKVASLDAVTTMKLHEMGIMQKGQVVDQKAFYRWLNDPDNRYFRTHPGTL